MFSKIKKDVTKYQYNLNKLEKLVANKLKYTISSKVIWKGYGF